MKIKYLRFVGCLFLLMNSSAFAIVNWPTGPAPCNNINDLESCLNGVTDGETVEIRANAIPGQSGVTVSPAKSLTLKAATSFSPVFASFTSLFFPGSDDDITVVVEGITIEVGNIRASQGGEGTFNVTFRDNVILDSSFNSAIQVSTGNTNPPYGPVIFFIDGNILNVNEDEASGISVGSFLGTGNQGLISNNHINASNIGQTDVINVNASSNSTFNVDVIGNEISGQGFDAGISFRLFGSGGFLNARAINNVITGQINTPGGGLGISLANSSNGFGHTNFEVINNTLAFNQRGIAYDGNANNGATSNATFINNIIAFNSSTAMGLFGFGATTIKDYNLVFDNGGYPYIPEANDIEQDPLFVSNVDFRLQSISPALNAGLNSAVPEDILTDIDGNMRIHQQDVDMGAYESSIATDVIFKNGFEN